MVLGAGRSISGNLPSAIVRVNPSHRVLDWLIASFDVIEDITVCFVGGYRIDLIEEAYPDIDFYFNPDWATTGPVKSLARVPLASTSATYIVYADVLFRPESITNMSDAEGDLILAVDRTWRNRYESRSRGELAAAEKISMNGASPCVVGRHLDIESAEAEFAGLLRLSPEVAGAVQDIVRSDKLGQKAGLPEMINALVADGVSSSLVDVEGGWSELNAPQDLARFVLGTKAESLERLRPLVRKGKIGEQFRFTEGEWGNSPHSVTEKIRDAFGEGSVIVRSSALCEDTWLQSSAGAYTSVLGVSIKDPDALREAVDEVVGSYSESNDLNQVLVQRMLERVTCNGVIMTRTPTLGSPYYVINFEEGTSRTDSVTVGDAEALRTIFLHREAKTREGFPAGFRALLDAVDEIETLVGHDSLDIEFAFNEVDVEKPSVINILQVRPIAVSHRDHPIDDAAIKRGLEAAQRYFEQLACPTPLILGQTTQLSVMTDWNPAEMIGTKPGRLAFSLYRYLITDETWAIQRKDYGYRDVRPLNLIVDVLGHPYVDVRVDFNSFVPASVPDSLAERLVDHYMNRLAENPELHDKVEFDILLTCYHCDFESARTRLREAGFSDDDILALGDALREITRNGIRRCAGDRAGLGEFETRYERICESGLPPLERAYLLLEDARTCGVLLFSHLARGAFIAVALLRSLEKVGVLSVEQVESFLASLRTVPSAMQEDARNLASCAIPWEEFVERYGHLRPGSYDVTSPRYDSAPEKFLRPVIEAKDKGARPGETPEVWDAETRAKIMQEIGTLGLDIDIHEYESFLREAIEGREFGKFSFTRNLSRALEDLAEFAASFGLGRDELAHIPIETLYGLRGAPAWSVRETLVAAARAGRDAMWVTQAVCLPGQIFMAEDIRTFEQVRAEPNFVTRKKVRAELVAISAGDAPGDGLKGKIVMVPSADPGFDWLFSSGLGGLITMYGGVNSHMAIRAAEFELPAAIGVGELAYDDIRMGRMIELDCASRKIEVIH